jgi:hypothetical protein
MIQIQQQNATKLNKLQKGNWILELTNIIIENYDQNWNLSEYIENIEEYTQNQNKTKSKLR